MIPVYSYTRVRSITTKCTRGRGCNGHPAFPTPSLGGRAKQCLGRIASRGRTYIWNWKSCLELEQTPSFRGDAKHRTRNLEIPRCAIAHLRSGPADHPGMTVSGLLSEVIHRATKNAWISLSLPPSLVELRRTSALRNDDRNKLILLRALSSPCALARSSDALSWWGDASPGVRGNAPTAWRMPCPSGFAAGHPSG